MMEASLISSAVRIPALEGLSCIAVEEPLHTSSSSELPHTTSPAQETSENVITLVDSSGREFHTNLRASDLEYLVKYSIISSLRTELRSHNRRQVAADTKRNISRTDALLAGNRRGTNGQQQQNFSPGHPAAASSSSTIGETSERLHYAHRIGSSKRSRNALLDDLKGKRILDILDDPIVQDFQRHLLQTDQTLDQNGSKATKQRSLPKKRSRTGKNRQLKTEEENGRVSRKRANGRGKRCRKVYGTEQRDKWCRQCKWKKSCARFADPVDGRRHPPEEGRDSESPATPTRSRPAQQQTFPAPPSSDTNLSLGDMLLAS